MLLEKFRKTRNFKLDEDDQDWLDDVEIDNRQAMEMADTYTNIMAQMNDSFSLVPMFLFHGMVLRAGNGLVVWQFWGFVL